MPRYQSTTYVTLATDLMFDPTEVTAPAGTYVVVAMPPPEGNHPAAPTIETPDHPVITRVTFQLRDGDTVWTERKEIKGAKR